MDMLEKKVKNSSERKYKIIFMRVYLFVKIFGFFNFYKARIYISNIY